MFMRKSLMILLVVIFSFPTIFLGGNFAKANWQESILPTHGNNTYEYLSFYNYDGNYILIEVARSLSNTLYYYYLYDVNTSMPKWNRVGGSSTARVDLDTKDYIITYTSSSNGSNRYYLIKKSDINYNTSLQSGTFLGEYMNARMMYYLNLDSNELYLLPIWWGETKDQNMIRINLNNGSFTTTDITSNINFETGVYNPRSGNYISFAGRYNYSSNFNRTNFAFRLEGNTWKQYTINGPQNYRPPSGSSFSNLRVYQAKDAVYILIEQDLYMLDHNDQLEKIDFKIPNYNYVHSKPYQEGIFYNSNTGIIYIKGHSTFNLGTWGEIDRPIDLNVMDGLRILAVSEKTVKIFHPDMSSDIALSALEEARKARESADQARDVSNRILQEISNMATKTDMTNTQNQIITRINNLDSSISSKFNNIETTINTGVADIKNEMNNLSTTINNQMQALFPPVLDNVKGYQNATATNTSTFRIVLEHATSSGYFNVQVKYGDTLVHFSGWKAITSHDSVGYYEITGLSYKGLYEVIVELSNNADGSGAKARKKMYFFKL